ncbi:MAG: hypothetical protein M0037_06890, partial [Betaproteobacteria bacterium]|nr:hypothetical protein [Betaproteobacteria bacterium]
LGVTSRISATGAASLSRGPQPVTADPAELLLWSFAVPLPPRRRSPPHAIILERKRAFDLQIGSGRSWFVTDLGHS